MPKKFATENSKAVAAKERKDKTKKETASKSQKEIEDASWIDDNKQLKKKQKKKEVEEKKKQEALQRKTEAKAILEKEMNESPKTSKPTSKITRAKISDKMAAFLKSDKEEKHVETHLDVPLFENTNRLEIEGEIARTVDDAISILNSNKDDIDKHPEKRMKAAYTAYQKRRLDELKVENTGLRLSQLKQMIFKEWEKCPENPSNQ